ncbi:hypothetical protein PENTCL1PPCAC_23781, partial [Pristionchus entomophagus]
QKLADGVGSSLRPRSIHLIYRMATHDTTRELVEVITRIDCGVHPRTEEVCIALVGGVSGVINLDGPGRCFGSLQLFVGRVVSVSVTAILAATHIEDVLYVRKSSWSRVHVFQSPELYVEIIVGGIGENLRVELDDIPIQSHFDLPCHMVIRVEKDHNIGCRLRSARHEISHPCYKLCGASEAG